MRGKSIKLEWQMSMPASSCVANVPKTALCAWRYLCLNSSSQASLKAQLGRACNRSSHPLCSASVKANMQAMRVVRGSTRGKSMVLFFCDCSTAIATHFRRNRIVASSWTFAACQRRRWYCIFNKQCPGSSKMKRSRSVFDHGRVCVYKSRYQVAFFFFSEIKKKPMGQSGANIIIMFSSNVVKFHSRYCEKNGALYRFHANSKANCKHVVRYPLQHPHKDNNRIKSFFWTIETMYVTLIRWAFISS